MNAQELRQLWNDLHRAIAQQFPQNPPRLRLRDWGTTRNGTAFFTVDMRASRWGGAQSPRALATPQMMDHLSLILGRVVMAQVGRGLTFMVLLDGPRQKGTPLPERVDMTEDLIAVFPPRRAENLLLPLGFGYRKGRQPEHWWVPWTKAHHIIILGKTGSGKSSYLRTLLYYLLHAPPSVVQLVAIDYGQRTLAALEGVAHLARPEAGWSDGDNWVVLGQDEERILNALAWVQQEVHERNATLRLHPERPDSIEEYNRLSDVPLSRLFVVFDELAAFLNTSKYRKEAETYILDIVREGRAVGVHFIGAIQDAYSETIARRVLSQMHPIVFRPPWPWQAKALLRTQKLPSMSLFDRPGRGVAAIDEDRRRFQAYFVERETFLAYVERRRIGIVSELSDEERRLVRLAVEHLGGRFTRDRLAELSGMTKHQVDAIARRLERRKLLTPARSTQVGRGKQPRLVTPLLMEKAGIDPLDLLQDEKILDPRVREMVEAYVA